MISVFNLIKLVYNLFGRTFDSLLSGLSKTDRIENNSRIKKRTKLYRFQENDSLRIVFKYLRDTACVRDCVMFPIVRRSNVYVDARLIRHM